MTHLAYLETSSSASGSFLLPIVALLVSIAVAGFILLLTSTLMYLVEGHEQPEVFGSIPRSMWWAIATLTTVGYGDVTPVAPTARTTAMRWRATVRACGRTMRST